MDDLITAVRTACACAGIRSIKMRSGSFPFHEAPISTVLPYLAAYINVMSRVTFAREAISCQIHRSGSSFSSYGGILGPSAFSGVLLDAIESSRDGDEWDIRLIEDDAIQFDPATPLNEYVNSIIHDKIKSEVCGATAAELESQLNKQVAIEATPGEDHARSK